MFATGLVSLLAWCALFVYDGKAQSLSTPVDLARTGLCTTVLPLADPYYQKQSPQITTSKYLCICAEAINI